ncbi:MAG: thiol:disulfide interchange protein TlpA [Rhizobiaceae bacterium]
MSDGEVHMSPLRLFGFAAIAGMAAGAIGLYVMGAPSGNNAPAASASAETACQGREETLARIDPAIGGEVAAMLPADPSRPLGDLAFNAPDGEPMQLADLSGKLLLVNLWATWCAPCRHEMPALDELQREMGGESFEVVAVNVETGDDLKPKAFLDEIGVDSLAFYRDNTVGLFNDLKRRNLALGLPVTLLIDEEGCLLAHMNGPAEWASDDAKALIRAAMAEQPAGS